MVAIPLENNYSKSLEETRKMSAEASINKRQLPVDNLVSKENLKYLTCIVLLR